LGFLAWACHAASLSSGSIGADRGAALAGEAAQMAAALTPAAVARFPVAAHALAVLSELYDQKAKDAFFLTRDHQEADRERARWQVELATSSADAALYGEILPQAFIEMLTYVGACPGMKYYDLGSGFGKTVLLAGLLGLNATGVELVDQRWDESCRALQRGVAGGQLQNVTLVHASFLDYDFSDADVVFTDSLAFSEGMVRALAAAARRLRPGALVVSAEGLPGENFRELGIFTGDASFSKDVPWTVQQVVGGGALETGNLAPLLQRLRRQDKPEACAG